MELADIVCQRPEVSVRNTASGAILVNLATGQCWQLNRIGADFLEQIRTERTIGEVCDALGSRYQVSRDVLERDVCRLTEELLGGRSHRPERTIGSVTRPSDRTPQFEQNLAFIFVTGR